MTDFKIGGLADNSDDDEDDEGLEIDDTLPPLLRLCRYAQSPHILHRLHVVRELPETAAASSLKDNKERLVPVLAEMSTDAEPVVRQALVEQITPLAQLYRAGTSFVSVRSLDDTGAQPQLVRDADALALEAYTEIVLPLLIPIVGKLILDSNPQVRRSASDALVAVSQTINAADRSAYVLPIIRSLASDTTEEEHRVEAASLFNMLAEQLGAEQCTPFVDEFFSRFAADPMFRVRKAIAANLGRVVLVLSGTSVTDTVLPIFLRLCTDEIWGVRKACAESILSVAGAVTADARRDFLVPVVCSLAEDPSRWVRSAAFQHLGAFLATLRSDDVSTTLLSLYTAMAENSNDPRFGDSESSAYCAFNFPAVLLTLGPARWAEVRDAFHTLVKDLQWKVRRTLAYSLHEVAKILGPEQTESELLGTLDLFLRDLDEVKVGAVRGLAAFMSVVSITVRRTYLPVLMEINADSVNWRLRKLVAKQLGEVAVLFAPVDIHQYILPLASQLYRDPVWSVRRACAAGVAKLLLSVATDEAIAEGARSNLIELAHSTLFSERQTFASLCFPVVAELAPEFFQPYYPHLMALARDPVANVRLEAGRVVALLETRSRTSSEVTKTLLDLRGDKDRDVRAYSSSSPTSPASAAVLVSDSAADSAAAEE